VEGVT